MSDDMLINLGPEWGHIVPLGVLEKITHIEFMESNHINVVCEFHHEDKRKPFVFKSRKPFTDEEATKQTDRLLSYSNGLIPRDDVTMLVESLAKQSEVDVPYIMSDTSIDISAVRKLWASQQGEPYFRFVAYYDPETQNIMIDESHNDLFEDIPSDWSDPLLLKDMTTEDRIIMMMYEVISGLADPIMPEMEDGGALVDPNANIPVMGSGIRTSNPVDLSKLSNSQKLMG